MTFALNIQEIIAAWLFENYGERDGDYCYDIVALSQHIADELQEAMQI